MCRGSEAELRRPWIRANMEALIWLALVCISFGR